MSGKNNGTRKTNIETAAKIGISAIAVLILCRTELFGSVSPLVVAFVAAAPPVCGAAGLMSAVSYFIFSGKITGGFAILLASALALTVRLVLICLGRADRAKISAAAAVLLFFASAVLAGGSIGDKFFSAIFCGAASYALGSFLDDFSKRRKLADKGKAGVLTGAVYILAVTALCGTSAASLNGGLVFGITVTLLMSGRGQTGCICAALTALGVSLYSPALGHQTMLLPFFAAAASLLKNRGEKYYAFVFAAGNLLYFLMLGFTADNLVYLANLLAACAFCAAFPRARFDALFETGDALRERGEMLSQKRLSFIASAIKELRKDTLYVSEALNRRGAEASPANRLSSMFCRECERRTGCWEERGAEAAGAFACFRPRATISPSTLPRYFDDCPNRMELAREFGFMEKERELRRIVEGSRRETQDIVLSLLEAQEEVFRAAAKTAGSGFALDSDASRTVEALLEENGAAGAYAAAGSRDGVASVEAYFDGDCVVDIDRIGEDISSALSGHYAVDSIVRTGDGARLALSEETALSLNFGFARLSADDEICGDYCLNFSDGFGGIYVALSDGMGHGRPAALNSRLCVSLLKKLVCSGISHYAAAGIINAAMMIKSSDESFATLDVTKIDSFSGAAELMKSGASATLVKTGGKVVCIKAASFPLGIVSVAEPYRKSLSLKSGDGFVMVSDGVDEEYYPYIKSLLLHRQSGEEKKLADEICRTVSGGCIDGKRDDISICVGFIN